MVIKADKQNGLVKGGIRLSYSKNSLGQRGQSNQPFPATSYGGISPRSPPSSIDISHLDTRGPIHSFSSLGPSQGSQHRDTTTLSPTAQPFNVPISSIKSSSITSNPISPKSRYFDPLPSSATSGPRSQDTDPDARPIPITGPAGRISGSPSSPIRSPKAFSSWVSTGSVGNGYSGPGFPSSLGGVASTWGSHTSG